MAEFPFVNNGNACANSVKIIRGAQSDCAAADDDDISFHLVPKKREPPRHKVTKSQIGRIFVLVSFVSWRLGGVLLSNHKT
jgi:hypothetical protein